MTRVPGNGQVPDLIRWLLSKYTKTNDGLSVLSVCLAVSHELLSKQNVVDSEKLQPREFTRISLLLTHGNSVSATLRWLWPSISSSLEEIRRYTTQTRGVFFEPHQPISSSQSPTPCPRLWPLPSIWIRWRYVEEITRQIFAQIQAWLNCRGAYFILGRDFLCRLSAAMISSVTQSKFVTYPRITPTNWS